MHKYCMKDEIHNKDKNYVKSHLKSDNEIIKIESSFKNTIQKELDSLVFDTLI